MKNEQRVVDSNFDRLQAGQGVRAKNQSQMTKLLPQLMVGSKQGPTEEQVRAKMEQRIASLKILKDTLVKANMKVADLYMADKSTRLKRLTTAKKSVEAILKEKLPQGVGRQVEACINELTSLREGVFTGAATTKKSLAVLASTEAVAHVERILETAQARLAKAKAEALGMPTAGSEEGLDFEEVSKILKQTQKESKNIVQLKTRPFVIARVPVIPITKGFINIERLKSQGMNVETIGGYAVVHNQLVIGINRSMLGLSDSEKHRSTDPKRIQAAALEILKSIQKTTKQKLQFVDDRAFGAVGGAWFWVMPERDLNLFASVMPGKVVHLERWGFAV